MLKIEEGSWYQGYISIYDQTTGLRDTGLRVIVEVLNICRGRGFVKPNKFSESGYDFIDHAMIWTDIDHVYPLIDTPMIIYPPQSELNPSEGEFAVAQKESGFGWPEFVYFDAGYEINIETAHRRLKRRRKTTPELIKEVVKSAPRESPVLKRGIVTGTTHGAQWVSFDEVYGRSRILRRGEPEAVFEASRRLRDAVLDELARRNGDGAVRPGLPQTNPEGGRGEGQTQGKVAAEQTQKPNRHQLGTGVDTPASTERSSE